MPLFEWHEFYVYITIFFLVVCRPHRVDLCLCMLVGGGGGDGDGSMMVVVVSCTHRIGFSRKSRKQHVTLWCTCDTKIIIQNREWIFKSVRSFHFCICDWNYKVHKRRLEIVRLWIEWWQSARVKRRMRERNRNIESEKKVIRNHCMLNAC